MQFLQKCKTVHPHFDESEKRTKFLNSHYLVFSCESFKLFKKMLCRQRSLNWNYDCTSPKYCIFAYCKRSVLKAYFLSVPYSASDHFSELSSLALFTCFVTRLQEYVKLDCLGKTWLFLFVWSDLIVLQLKLMCNALFSDKMRDDFKEMKREIRIISNKLKSQMTSAEERIDLMCWWRFYWTLHNYWSLKFKLQNYWSSWDFTSWWIRAVKK